MVEEEVKKYLQDNPPEGGCNCEYPPDIIIGGDAETNIKDTILIFDNGDSDDVNFDYIMADFEDNAVIEPVDRVIFAGDADPSDDKKYLSFEEWIKAKNLDNLYYGGNSEQKEQIENMYILWNGGGANTSW